jgi:hypothetical protein
VGDLWPSSRVRPVRGSGSENEPEYAVRARLLREAASNVVFTERYRNV